MKIETKLGMGDYIRVVDMLADAYFDEDGNYLPHHGIINAMMVFYDICVTESQFDEDYGHDLYKGEDMEEIVKDEEFIREFNRAINPTEDNQIIDFTFKSAYRDAMSIVNMKLNTMSSVVDILRKNIMSFANKISPIITKENLDRIIKINSQISDGSLDIDKIIDIYSKSER